MQYVVVLLQNKQWTCSGPIEERFRQRTQQRKQTTQRVEMQHLKQNHRGSNSGKKNTQLHT